MSCLLLRSYVILLLVLLIFESDFDVQGYFEYVGMAVRDYFYIVVTENNVAQTGLVRSGFGVLTYSQALIAKKYDPTITSAACGHRQCFGQYFYW